MKRFKIKLFLAISCIYFYHLTSMAISSASQKNICKLGQCPKQPVIATKIQKVIDESSINPKQLGIVISRGNEVVFRLNDQKLFIPASLVKIFTAGALLDFLSPNLQFSTRFLSIQPLNGSVLKGDLYLLGGGDPSFVSESLWNLVNHLLRTGLKQVTRDLIVDRSYFDYKRSNQKSHQKKNLLLPKAYFAPSGALSFNWNAVNIYLRPAKQSGHPLKVFIDPSSFYFRNIINRTKTTSTGGLAKNIRVEMTQTDQKKRQIKIIGQMGLDHKELVIYRSISEPALWTGWNAMAFLKQRGIVIKGRVKNGSLTKPNSRHLLAQWEGKPLTENIRLMMKYSNNYMAEMLTKNLATLQTGKKGTLRAGIKILKNHIKEKLQIAKTNYQLTQPSGLSRSNRFRPWHLWVALNYWSKHPLQAEFESALPLAGYDGTLKDRFLNSNIKGHLHAKTGHLNGVTSLAGYINTPNHKKQMFVFIFNGKEKNTLKAEKLFDQMAQVLYEFKH